MALTDTAIRNAKAQPKPYKMADARGLFLLVQPSGGKLWRLKYRIGGKEKKLALGRYPDVCLKDARARCAAARSMVADGTDPSDAKKAAALAAALNAATTFKLIADEYIAKTEREGRAEATVSKSRWLLALMAPSIGHIPIADISPAMMLVALKKVEARGNLESAQRMRAFAGRVFRYAISTSRALVDPTGPLQGALQSPKAKHHAAILDEDGVGALLRSFSGYDGQPATKLALQFAPHVFVRPGEMRHAEWSEIDINAAVWKIPGDKMKSRRPHAVPLSRQAITILEALKPLAGNSRYVFPSIRSAARPMSENTINAALRRMGYASDEMTGHGFRALASTLLNECGKWSADAIERALAHQDRDAVRAAYHRGPHWEERTRMAQWWSDHLDGLRDSIKL